MFYDKKLPRNHMELMAQTHDLVMRQQPSGHNMEGNKSYSSRMEQLQQFLHHKLNIMCFGRIDVYILSFMQN